MEWIEKTTLLQRRIILLISDGWMSALSVSTSFLVFYGSHEGLHILETHLWFFGLFVLIRLASFKVHGLYSYIWRYASTREFIAIFRAVSLSSMVIVAVFFMLGMFPYHKGIFLMEWLLNVFLVGSTRVVLKLYREYSLSKRKKDKTPGDGSIKNLLIVGAGEAAVICAREILRAEKLNYKLIGFIDDNQEKIGRTIFQSPVLGSTSQMSQLIQKHHIEEVVIAMPSASGDKIRLIIEELDQTDVNVKTTPSISDIIDGTFSVSQLREVRIEDLLRRDVISLDTTGIETFLTKRVVLVTGAGGSIGSELCRQIIKYEPKQLLLLDLSENFTYHIEYELRQEGLDHVEIIPIVLDVKNRKRLERVFQVYRPEIVFHAAAHKHVPLMEVNVQEVIENNVVGTRNVFQLADQYEAKDVVLISTDKAVRTTNCMGATKRLCEIMLQVQSESSKTKFAAVRFGNVLGSHGSVVPLFKKQIAQGGPITVTHQDMTRFFMTIPEAVSLVLQAGSFSHGGEIFILDMGKPVKILDLARDLISLSGLEEGKDIDIKITGLRAGEKLHEELFFDESDLQETRHKKIFITSPTQFDRTSVDQSIDELLEFVALHNTPLSREKLMETISKFQKQPEHV